jgi:hypothetical protein
MGVGSWTDPVYGTSRGSFGLLELRLDDNGMIPHTMAGAVL